MSDVTIVITPRDRYTGVAECISSLYASTREPFDLFVLDLGYPKALIETIEAAVRGKAGARIVRLGRMIPMQAIEAVRGSIETPFTVLLDNDSRVTEEWLPPLLQCARSTASALVTPLILEREGVDDGAALRNHMSTSELRVVEHEQVPYLVEYKPYRRATADQVPKEQAATDLFELHCVLLETAVLNALDIPLMLIREHIDIGMQIRAMGRVLTSEPRSVVIFDNLNHRMALPDIRFFFYRWSAALATRSSRLFEERWGYRFYSERSMMNWIVRRKVYLLARWLMLPSNIANRAASIWKKLFLKDWDPIRDAEAASKPFYASLPDGRPRRRDLMLSDASAPATALAASPEPAHR